MKQTKNSKYHFHNSSINIVRICYLLIICVLYIPNVFSQDKVKLKSINWPFSGVFSTFNRAQLQRGLQVYQEVCATCHGINLLRYEKLKDLGFSIPEIKVIAAQSEIPGPVDDEGEPTTKKAEIGDYFAQPYTNAQAARAANNGSFPPDLSLIIKARLGGADYLYSLLTGYTDPPKEIKVMEGMYYNQYFPGQQIAMIPPFVANQVTYTDGTIATVEQMAKDVTTFLAWVAEPETEYRRQLGIKVICYLIFLTLLMYLLMCRVWKRIQINQDLKQ